ncbi:MAG: response regulator [Roseburia inulinivorans]
MKRNLLFISRYPEIIDEFQGILEEKQIETDIAQNGTDAMELLKQKEYQILVTDLNLDGYNGDKILSYVNQEFPDTICMLYTNSISAVQLGFYLNKRDVFRVFLRPVNFRQEFMQALEEAYEFYDLKKHDRDSRQERLKQLEGNRKAIAEIEKIIENQNGSWKDFEDFCRTSAWIYHGTIWTGTWNVEQRRQYFAKEKKLLRAMCENPDTHNIARAQNEAEVLMK